MDFRLIGSLGIYGLTNECPRILRGHGRKSARECVDIDILICLPDNPDLSAVKKVFDSLWQSGMNSDLQVPISPVNLPKSIANDPNQVLDIDWRISGNDLKITTPRNKICVLSMGFLEPMRVNIFGTEVFTLSPFSQVLFKFIRLQYNNPIRLVKDLKAVSSINRKYDFSNEELPCSIDDRAFRRFLRIANLFSTKHILIF